MSIRRLADKAVVFDAFPKVEADNQSRSEKGGLLSVLLACFLLFLTWSELSEYRRTQVQYDFTLDASIDKRLQVNMDLTVAMPCTVLLVHVYDVSGQRLHLSDNLKMIPTEFSTTKANSGKTLNDPKYIKEIVKAASGQAYDTKVAIDMGACRIFGSIQANKLAANLHITAAGHGYQGQHTDHAVMNFTHRIDEFSFGEFYPSLVNPLDNSLEVAETHFEAFDYFLSVVPTTYFDKHGKMLLTNQYAVTDARRTFPEKLSAQVVPGIFFKYDLEAVTVVIKETHRSLFDLVVRLFGIIGGSVVTVGFVYRALRFAWTGGKEDPNLYAPVHNLFRSV
ncbi:endoplasmic reticulum vesicle transporter-domain-containing protein [Gongronella butleri]|nr:endoplasmic reticulum vesicle transporter-domain-containing protein [Gongronella butleri]